jgi:hypothetical protein
VPLSKQTSDIPAIEIGGLNFASKAAAAEHFRRMLHQHEIGIPILEPAATELQWLLERHPEYRDKAGCGVEHFSVREAIYGTRCFEIVRVDGSTTDFSFTTCVNGKAPSAVAQAIEALRAEVADDITEKKRELFRDCGNAEGKLPCALTGALIAIDGAHADHAPPRTFGTLAIAFLEARGIDPAAPGLITPHADNQYQPRLLDPELARAWRAYHHKLAVIRVVAKQANLARAHQGKVREKDRQLRLI